MYINISINIIIVKPEKKESAYNRTPPQRGKVYGFSENNSPVP